MIGVSLIILVVGLVEGFRQTIQDEITAEGIDTAFVSRFDQGPQNGHRPKDEKTSEAADTGRRHGDPRT